MDTFWQDSNGHLHCAFSIYGSKAGVDCRSTLFTDLNLEEITADWNVCIGMDLLQGI